MYPYLNKIFIAIILISVLIFVTNAYFIYTFSKQYSEKKSDVIIVLGTKIEQGKVSALFKERIDQGIQLHQKGIAPFLLFTGGKANKKGETESSVARDYAISKGVPKESILIDNKAYSTFQNLKYSKQIMDSINIKTALIVSDPYHMKRAMAFAKHFQIDAEVSPTPTSTIKGFLPKSFALVYETFFYMVAKGVIFFNLES